MNRIVIKNAEVLDKEGQIVKKDIAIADGKIIGVGHYSDWPADKTIDVFGASFGGKLGNRTDFSTGSCIVLFAV